MSYDQNIKNIFKLLISIVNDCRKDIGWNSHTVVIKKYYVILTNW